MIQNWEVIEGLEPAEVFAAFALIREINCGPGCEEDLAHFIVGLATQRHFHARCDGVPYNVVVYLEATPGYEDRQPLCLQSHLDMEAIGQDGKDFDTGTIEFVVEDGKLRGKNTALGASGIGVAIGVALIEKDFEHGPLELLFTADKEGGLNGAMSLDPDWITSRMLINLDSDEWGKITLGCAGGGRIRIPILADIITTTKDHCLYPQFTLEVFGLKGGYSGTDIGKNRTNAILFMAQVLKELLDSFPTLRIVSFEGGGLFNPIPTRCRATLIIQDCDPRHWESILDLINFTSNLIVAEFSEDEAGDPLAITQLKGAEIDYYFHPDFSNNLVKLINELPAGVVGFNLIEAVVESSNNIATIGLKDGYVFIETMYRAFSDDHLKKVKKQIFACANLFFGVIPEVDKEYPAWQPRYNFNLLKKADHVFIGMFLAEDESEYVIAHGGLECTYFASKWPGIEMISIGPTIHNSHSQNEYVVIGTVLLLYNWVLEIIEEME